MRLIPLLLLVLFPLAACKSHDCHCDHDHDHHGHDHDHHHGHDHDYHDHDHDHGAVREPADNTLTTGEKDGGWILLFNGNDLAGWKINKENPESVFVEDGHLVTHGKRAHLFYGEDGNAVFKDFELVADVKCVGPSNSGIFFHTKFQDGGWPGHGFEAQVCNGFKDPRKTGSVYSFSDIRDNSPAKDDVWFHYRLKVVGKNVKIWIDGKLVQDWTEPDDWAQKTKKIGSGTIALQAHDPGSKVLFKNMKLRKLD